MQRQRYDECRAGVSAAVRRWGECRVARGVASTSEASEVELDLGQPPQLQLRREPPRVSDEASRVLRRQQC